MYGIIALAIATALSTILLTSAWLEPSHNNTPAGTIGSANALQTNIDAQVESMLVSQENLVAICENSIRGDNNPCWQANGAVKINGTMTNSASRSYSIQTGTVTTYLTPASTNTQANGMGYTSSNTSYVITYLIPPAGASYASRKAFCIHATNLLLERTGGSSRVAIFNDNLDGFEVVNQKISYNVGTQSLATQIIEPTTGLPTTPVSDCPALIETITF